jgi:chloride channel 7
MRTLLVKLAGSVGAVAGGLAVGKEGPFVHAGAAIGALLSQGGPAGHAPAWFRRFWNDRDRADLVACGSAAGVAAAFRSPVGGVLFALEETTTWWRNQLLWYAFFTTAVVSVAGG